jgi:uncharacterized protein YbjT (DUF2867 family)
MNATADVRDTVVIAGATGFVGQALGARLGDTFHVVGLSRSERMPGDGFAEWRACDLFSLKDAERGLRGARYAVYLVHSMMPSARLTQGRFEDLDLICADNFARAAKQAGVEQVVYLGGLLPDVAELSRHLESRSEVERTLAGHGVPTTTLRAGLVVGAHGSSFQMMLRLVKRLPVMVVPKWTSTKCQPVALSDVVELLAYVLGRPSCIGQTYDIGGPEVLTYREMMEQTAEALGVKRRMWKVPVISPGLSRLWVSTITGAPKELVQPLIHSLAHSMVAGDRRLQDDAGLPGMSFRESIRRALDESARTERSASPAAYAAPTVSGSPRGVRSVQRLPLPPEADARWVAEEYMRWLPGGMRPLRVEVDADRVCRFFIKGLSRPLLILSFAPDRSASDRQLFYITGGLLARDGGRGRLEMRETSDRKTVIAAIHEFRPRLPWFIYRNTQAVVHVVVMHMFGRHLLRVSRAARPSSDLARAAAT